MQHLDAISRPPQNLAYSPTNAGHDGHAGIGREGDENQGKDACALREASGGSREGMRTRAPRVQIEPRHQEE